MPRSGVLDRFVVVWFAVGALLPLFLADSAPLAAAPAGPRIAVVEFTSASTDKELEALGKGLQSMVATDLAQVPGLRLVERERLKEVEAELKLGRSGQIDKSTAARVGKLAGATHLLGGTFTVVGTRMRIDARLFSVQTGDVLVAEQIEGERDAFFELEKKLGQKVIDSLGITLKPRERAALAKVQTADFDAFRSFSRGLAAFDDKRYQDAITAMADATQRDKDFQLAARTLDDYQRIVADLKQKAQALDTAADSQAEREAREKQAKQSAKWAPAIEQLWKLASAPGGGQAQQDRIAAILLLAKGYRHQFDLRWPRGDQFALDRTADELERRYVAEAAPLFPRIPPIPSEHGWTYPGKDQSVTDWVRAAWAELEHLMVGIRRRLVVEELTRAFNDCQHPESSHDALVNALLVDGKGTLRFAERLDRWRVALEEDARSKNYNRTFFASLYRDQLELERSTALLAEQSRADASQAYAMRKDAAEIQTNQHILELVQTSKSPDLVREMLLLGGVTNSERIIKEYLMTSPPAAEGYRYLLSSRGMPRGYILVGDVPVWLIHAGSEGEISTGPRSDRRRTSEVRYWPDVQERRFTPGGAPSLLLLAGGKPWQDLRGKFTVRFAMPDDFRAGVADHLARAKAAHIPGAFDVPEVGFAFGIQQARGDDKLPTTGFVALLDHRVARLARFVIAKPEDTDNQRNPNTGVPKEILTTVIEEHPLALPKADRLDVTVSLKGGALELAAGSRKVSFRAPADRNGFAGVMFRQLGYASVGALGLGAP